MAITRGTNFPAQIVTEMFNKVGGHSALAKLSTQKPLPFNGVDVVTFSTEAEAALVAEGAAKPAQEGSTSIVQIRPQKFFFGQRVSDEFIYASEAVRLEYLRAFADAFSRKIARAIDISGIHGVDPNSKQTVAAIAQNNFDAVVTNRVTYAAAQADENIEAAVRMITGADKTVSGLILSPAMAAALAAIKYNGIPAFPELAWGANPDSIKGMRSDVNGTLAFNTSGDQALIGDFENAFRWGYAKDVPFEIIRYGDPDNSGVDLAGHNQVFLRAEAFVGWGILDPAAFAIVGAAQ